MAISQDSVLPDACNVGTAVACAQGQLLVFSSSLQWCSYVVCTMLFAPCCQSRKVVCPFVGNTADLVLRDTDSCAFMCLTVTHVV